MTVIKGRKRAYDNLVEITGKGRHAIKKFFQRKKMNVLDIEDRRIYIDKFLKVNTSPDAK